MIMNNLKVQVRVDCTFGKPQAVEKSIHPGIPYSRSLFQSIQGHFYPPHMELLTIELKSMRFLDVHILLNYPT